MEGVVEPSLASDDTTACVDTDPSSASNNEIEEGELPSEEFCKPLSPTKSSFVLFPLLCDDALQPQQQEPIVPRKPVLGKEKAKQRLKALGIQKKIQMESRNQITPKRLMVKQNPDLGAASTGGIGKRDKKLLSPHEKAQLTINEIEVMKREEEGRKVPIYYNESMIHRITADSYDENKRNAAPPTLTPSIEAIKSYEDENYRGDERRRKRSKPEAYRRRRRSSMSPLTTKRKLKFKGDRSNGQLESSRERRKKGRKTRRKSQSVNQESEERFTRTRPVISFRFNPVVFERKTKSKLRKKAKRKQELNDLEKNEKDHAGHKEKRKTRRRSLGSKDGRSSNLTKKVKKKKRKSVEARKPAGILSFAIDDLNFEEEIDDFPLSKEGFQPTSDSEDRLERKPTSHDETISQDVKIEVCTTPEPAENLRNSPLLTGEVDVFPTIAVADAVVEDKSPDTDDYMPNWEEEDDDDSDKYEVAAAFLCKTELPCDPSNDDAYSSTEETTPESIKDGLGTPIFVNPSPPDEDDLSYDPRSSKRDGLAHQLKKDVQEHKESDEEESLTPPIVQPKHLFEMENIYEQFLQSVREDPDFKDIADKGARQSTFGDSPTSTHDTESGFLSQSSAPTASPFTSSNSSNSPSSSASSTSNQTSESNDSSDTDSSEKQSSNETAPRNDTKQDENSLENDAASDPDDLANISPEDLKKLKSVQKRHGMLKWIRQQIDGMDEEDRQCLLGLEKLIRAERQLLLRNDSIKRLHERKHILGTDSEDSKDFNESKINAKCDTEESNSNEFILCSLEENAAAVAAAAKTLSTDVDNGEIFDAKREAIKMTITNYSSMKILPKKPLVAGGASDKAIGDDDQDFTERLMKAKERQMKSSPNRTGEKPSRGSRKRKDRRGRSLSMSPMRRSRKSPARARQSDRTRRQAYSPSPGHSRRRESKSSSRNRRSAESPRRSRRSSRRSCRSTTSASPTQSRSSSRSTSRSPTPEKDGAKSPTDENVLESYPVWNIDRYSQYYIGDSYYYPRIPSGDNADDKQSRYPTVYHEYAPYNLYANEYMSAHPGYMSEYSHQSDYSESQANMEDSYLRIPVIGSSSAGASDGDYFYKTEFEDPNGIAQNTEIMHHDANNSAKPFAVQKGNVLEIVPATTIGGVVNEQVTIKTEPTGVIIKQEPNDDDAEALQKLLGADNSGNNKVDGKLSRKGHSWKNEVARRHVVSAVIRLNKETEDSPRGILKTRGNSAVVVKEKKKVLFADGIPPGRTSSASSDEEATLKLIRKRLKKTERRRRSENKENEILNEVGDIKNAMVESKADPELWDAPPPPPPPGSPPPHLPQPALIRPTSPEELLYFHYDPVYNMMYVSPMENAIPPRLLQNNVKPSAKLPDEAAAAENGEATIQDSNGAGPMRVSTSSPASSQDNGKEDEGVHDVADQKITSFPSPEHQNASDATPPPLPPPVVQEQQSVTPPVVPLQSSSPPQAIQNIVSMRMNNSPLLYKLDQSGVTASFESSHPSQSRSPMPIMVGYPGQIFGRMQNRRTSTNLVRGPFNTLPPLSPHSRAFNPHIPPPFHQSSSLNGHPLPPSNYEGPCPGGIPSMPPANGPQPSFSPNMMVFNSQQQQQQLPPPHALPPQGFGYGMAPPPHMLMNRPAGRFPSIPPPVPMPNFLHADRKGSPRMGSHVFRHHPPPLPMQSPSQNQSSTPPPVNPYS